MKISKTSLLLIAIGVFIIALIGLGVFRSQQVRQQNQLSERLVSAEFKLNEFQTEELNYQIEELERELSQIQAQAETAKTTLSQAVDSIATSAILFDIAEANGVQLTEIGSSGLTSVELNGVPCLVLPLTLKVVGDVTSLVSFITQLNSDLTTGIVNSVEMNIPETIGEEASAIIQMNTYAYRGS